MCELYTNTYKNFHGALNLKVIHPICNVTTIVDYTSIKERRTSLPKISCFPITTLLNTIIAKSIPKRIEVDSNVADGIKLVRLQVGLGIYTSNSNICMT